MILDSLRIINDTLNKVLKNEFETQDHMISVSGVRSTGSKIPLRLSLVNMDNEHTTHVAIGRQPTMTKPPKHTRLYIVISTNPETPYEEGIKMLDAAMNWFDENPLLTATTSPNLPKSIERIVIENYSQTLEGQSVLWQGLGAAYQPSVVYQLRVIGNG
ncbi:Pvc16 family protein [Psychroserpens sp. MEBiC05023]